MFYREHRRVPAPSGGRMMTKQEMAAECDIHNILKQYQRTGIVASVARVAPTFEDLPSVDDFQAGLHAIMAAEEAFAGLPAQLRATFDNDPERFLMALNDPAHRERLEEFGILKPSRPAEAAVPPAAKAD